MRKIIISDHTYEQINARQSGEGGEGLIARDQVAQSYFGQIGDRKSTEKTRNRLYWMAKQIDGADVLDVGCSEGVLSILAAREGFAVTGIDLNPDAIEYAVELSAQETKEVRKRVNFMVNDLASVADGKPAFDTVLVGEVIEHLLAPERLVQLCVNLLKPDGVLVITTPFGISSNYDHKQTLFPSDLVELSRGLLSVEHLSVDDGYIRYVGRKASKNTRFPIDRLLEVTEAGTFASQNAAQEIMDDRRKRIAKSLREIEKLKKSSESDREDLGKQREELAKTRASEDEALKQLAIARAELEAGLEQAEKAEALNTDLSNKLATARKDLFVAEEELDRLRKDLAVNDKKLATAIRDLSVAEEELDQLKKDLVDSEASVARLNQRDQGRLAEIAALRHTTARAEEKSRQLMAQQEDGEMCRQILSKLTAQQMSSQRAFYQPHRVRAQRRAKQHIAEDMRLVQASSLFDAKWYLSANPDVEESGVNPIEHYVMNGAYEMRDPGPDFSAFKYHKAHPDVTREGVPALLHYLRHGRAEDRRIFKVGEEYPAAFVKDCGKSDRAPTKAKSNPAPAEADSVPETTGSVVVKTAVTKPEPGPDALRLLTLLDEFTEKALEHDTHITRLSIDDWDDQIENGEFDAFFAESVWRGNGGDWNYAMSNPKSARHATLKAVLEACRKRGLPTVIWNKEDPPNFEVFKDSVVLFDHIFTSDVNCVKKYKELVGHDNVHALPFFAQPKLHNPIDKSERDDKQIVFAGSWYAQKHGDRSILAPALFDAASEHKFTIYDRHSEEKNGAGKYRFPDKYQKFLKPKVAYDQMLRIHKSFQVFLNVNSVTQSDTMFARRIFEVLACSTPIVSTASSGLEKMFGDIVPVVHDAEQARTALSHLLEDNRYRHRIGHLGYRRVMTEHTAQDRIDFIAKTCGLRSRKRAPSPKASWICATNRQHYLDNVVRNYLRQSHPNMELIIVLNSDDFDQTEVERQLADVPHCKVLQLPESAYLGDCLNAGIEVMEGDYFFKIDDDDVYFENYTSDMLLPFKYTQARIVGKQSVFSYLEAEDTLYQRFQHRVHRYSRLIAGPTLVADRRVLEKVPFGQFRRGTDTQWIRECLAAGEQVYSTDPFNFVLIRRSDTEAHTWRASAAEVTKNATKISDGFAMKYVRV
ncbi:glycosyltransferase family protein [Qipengyuania qiaonensis]|uniref:Methyltransferase domain-containing protein n=1 Tax=Qipengyuania qiaonensis TaxID=2867240 RepID=A0ABS7JGI6_9SPHN|nr:methyltransferase domain-containing protein [Qipengyuania qiaonensis]MBX7484152.1 methyltransferase domain-containing protein [Qipengyuania qiaonensis]